VGSVTTAWDSIFSPKNADANGLVAIGGSWGREILVEAYLRGCFPWPQEGLPLLWFSPLERGVIDFSEIKINRSLRRTIANHHWRVTFNTAFREVMWRCARVKRPGQAGTWILPEMIEPYSQLLNEGQALSCEIWNSQGDMVGGLYGVLSLHYFSAESMFYMESGASKVAFVEITHFLKKEKGFTWMDIQMLTPVTKSLGGKVVPQIEFLQRISR